MIVDVYTYFKENPKYNKLVGNDYLLVEYKCPIDVEEFQLWTDFHLITYVVSGKKDWISYNNTYEIEKGDALFVRKGVHATRQYYEVDYCVILFFMNDDFIKNFLNENDITKKSIPSKIEKDSIFEINVDDSLDSLILSVFNYLKNSREIPENLVEIKFKELLFTIILNPKNHKLAQFFTSIGESGKTNLEYIMLKNFQYDLSLEQYARLCGKSLSTFKREFKHFFNESPGEWIKNQRLQFATSLLKNTELTANEVCYECGFKNPSHFNKIFKDKFGLPPNQYRNLDITS